MGIYICSNLWVAICLYFEPFKHNNKDKHSWFKKWINTKINKMFRLKYDGWYKSNLCSICIEITPYI